MMGFRYPVEEHARKGMIVKMLQDGILKLNHFFFDKLFKQNETHELGMVENHMPP
jgi:hypothetical protein